MGKKIAPGTHTRVPTSPQGDPTIETATDTGTTHTIDGVQYAFVWDATQGLYRCRIPPPPANPPGEWVFLEFDEGEGFDVWHAQPQGSEVWTATGRDYANG